MLRDLGDELQRIKNFKVPGDTAQQLAVAKHGEWLAVGLFGAIHHLAITADRDHAVEAEGTSDHIRRDALQPGGITSVQSDTFIDGEARMLP